MSTAETLTLIKTLDLAVSKATKKLPSFLEDLLEDVFFYLKYSPKRTRAISALQSLLNGPEHKILQLHKVRWLSLESVVNRTLEQLEVLKAFFKAESETKIGSLEREKKSHERAKKVYDALMNPYTQLYYEFLSFVLKLVVKRNCEF